jgi:hypothetical protein
MPHLNHTGPDGQGPKFGRKLGKCKMTEDDLKKIGELGKGHGKKRNSGGGNGKGKRLKYNNKFDSKL